MTTEHFLVQNVKCGGCASNIQNGLSQLEGVEQVDVIIESGAVSVQGGQLNRGTLSHKLTELGYPEKE